MNLIQLAINRPMAILAAVLMTIMFGVIALNSIPIQLIPDIRKPVISIRTAWPSASPAEVEREITNRQEDVLKNIEGLEKVTSQSLDGQSRIRLEFQVGTNMERSLLLTANRLDRVNSYPAEADEPSMRTASAEDSPIAWFILQHKKPGNTLIHKFGDFTEDVIQTRFERVSGVARVNVYGISNKEMVVAIDPTALARYRLTVNDVINTLQAANSSVTAGDINEGKRRYIVRTEGEFSKIKDLQKVVIRSEIDSSIGRAARVTLGDIASVFFDHSEPTARIRANGDPALAINLIRETGANVINVMKEIKVALNELNSGPLKTQDLKLEQVYDETTYIKSAINLVKQNIFIGGALAALTLLLFLRSGGATLIVSLAIPISVVGAFVAMAFMGRSLNVISLAGIAFAVGMVVDAAIVVLENTYRMRELGQNSAQAAYTGANQVWGAILVSSLTTVMAFIPILIMDLEVGQLFRDIAVAISVSVLLSLLVSITVIPSLSRYLLSDSISKVVSKRAIPIIDIFAKKVTNLIISSTKIVTNKKIVALIVVITLSSLGIIITWVALPKLEYLPDGNRNLIFGVILPPPGYNLDTTAEIAGRFEDRIVPLLPDRDSSVPLQKNAPQVERFFFVASRGRTFVGASAKNPSEIKQLLPILKQAVFQEPGTFGVISQRSLFGRGIGGSRSIDLNVLGQDLGQILTASLTAVQLIDKVLPRTRGTQIRPKPGLELGAPEVRVFPNRLKLADNGISVKQFSNTLDTFNDGRLVTEITINNKRMDLMLRGVTEGVQETQHIGNLPIVTSTGNILTASDLADIIITSGPTQINHVEQERAVTLQIRPPENVPLETALDIIRKEVLLPLKKDSSLEGIKFKLTGTANKLNITWKAIKFDLLTALIIVYLVMAVLFESFIYPLIIMLSVPLATAGGVLGLAALNLFRFQPLDMLTLLGFVILIGIVVNNAILLVHQTLFNIRYEGMHTTKAIQESTKDRIRPIFMSTLTSVFGMLPLVMSPGAGSELYQGLGSVILGGLSLSAILTIAIIPPLLTLICDPLESQPSKKRKA